MLTGFLWTTNFNKSFHEKLDNIWLGYISSSFALLTKKTARDYLNIVRCIHQGTHFHPFIFNLVENILRFTWPIDTMNRAFLTFLLSSSVFSLLRGSMFVSYKKCAKTATFSQSLLLRKNSIPLPHQRICYAALQLIKVAPIPFCSLYTPSKASSTFISQKHVRNQCCYSWKQEYVDVYN